MGEGSNDGTSWTLIMEHKNDEKLKARGQLATWKVPHTDNFYTKFRIYMTGPNSNGQHYLALSGFEIYGTLDALPTKPPEPQETHKYAIIEISNATNDAINAMLGMTGMTVKAPTECLEEYLYEEPPIESSVGPPNFFNNDKEENSSDDSSEWETDYDDDDDHDEDQQNKDEIKPKDNDNDNDKEEK